MGRRGTMRSIAAAARAAERDAKRRHKQNQKMQMIADSTSAVEDWENYVDNLVSIHTDMADMIDWHVRGTRYRIGMDTVDGLLHAGEPGVQLTWMDAKVGDWVVTPRIGKPVEINALWYNALMIMADFAERLGQLTPLPPDEIAANHDRYSNRYGTDAASEGLTR